MSGAAVGAVVLAAGGSTRLGRPKQLLVWQGSTLIRRAVNAAADAGCASAVVVVGAVREAIEAELRETEAAIAFNPDWPLGLGTSIRCGVQHLINRHRPLDALVVLTCDQPLVDASVLASLIAQWRETRAAMVASRYQETVGIPALFDRSCFDDLLRLPDESGAKSLLQSQSKKVAEIPFAGGALDLDTPADLLRAGID